MPPRAPAAPRARKAAPWVGRRAVVKTVDGPLVGRWYFATGPGSWEAMLEAANSRTLEARRVAGHPDPDVLGYDLTDKLVPHPIEEVTGRALVWRATRGERRPTRRRDSLR